MTYLIERPTRPSNRVDRSEIAYLENRVVLLVGTATDEFITTPMGHLQLFKDVTILNLKLKDMGGFFDVSNDCHKFDHIYINIHDNTRFSANGEKHIIPVVIQNYDRRDGSRAYGVIKPQSIKDIHEGKLRACIQIYSCAVHELAYNRKVLKVMVDIVDKEFDTLLAMSGANGLEELATKAIHPLLIKCLMGYHELFKRRLERKPKKKVKRDKSKGFGK